MLLTTSQKIKKLCDENDISIAELARRLDLSPQNLSNKLKRNNFPEKELCRIADVLDCKFESFFITNSGKKI